MLDRKLQLELLQKMNEACPEHWNLGKYLNKLSEDEQTNCIDNLLYLEEHGLVISSIKRASGGHFGYGRPSITARGRDFIADDGGLSAILGTVTVKFHEDTLRQLFVDKVQASDLPAESKKKLNLEIQKLPAEAIKHLTLELLGKGLEQAPALLHTIRKFVGMGF